MPENQTTTAPENPTTVVPENPTVTQPPSSAEGAGTLVEDVDEILRDHSSFNRTHSPTKKIDILTQAMVSNLQLTKMKTIVRVEPLDIEHLQPFEEFTTREELFAIFARVSIHF